MDVVICITRGTGNREQSDMPQLPKRSTEDSCHEESGQSRNCRSDVHYVVSEELVGPRDGLQGYHMISKQLANDILSYSCQMFLL
jgi:hypothetical protein